MIRLAVVAAALLVLVTGCGESEKAVEPLLGKVDLARDAQAISSLQQALVAAALVRTESGGSYGSGPEDLAQRLQARDPSKRFGLAPSTRPEEMQVLGGGAGPAMLVVRSASNAYLAVWDDGGGATLYYRGLAPPQFTSERPRGEGWSEQPPR
jgi:hypothetical protein